MHQPLLRAALPAVLAGMVGLPPAHADIFTWVDASGRVNISNLDPPEGARVTNVLHMSAPNATVPDDAAREALRRAEVQALAERVRQLQDEVEVARRQAPPHVDYRVALAPPVAPNVGDWTPALPVQYAYAAPPPFTTGCDPSWVGCGLWWGQGVYSTSFIVVRAPTFHRFHRVRGGRDSIPAPPMRPPGGGHRR